ncbi:MAG: hypothetical protein ACMVY4_07555 [Minwuia sp.]|uniref:hypothetical protein n=1 Tax=Minwuia sp. TaxID=2493630 RepID=UPI003A89AED7
MQAGRKTLKILHSIASCGLVGGLAVYMILLVVAPQDTPAAYADLRVSIAAISNYVLLPSLGLALVTGLLSMAVHKPFMNKRWAWIKAAGGILMFKGVLAIVGSLADSAASISAEMAAGQDNAALLETVIRYEWHTLWAIMALSIANIVLGVWRPKLKGREKQRAVSATRPARTAG